MQTAKMAERTGGSRLRAAATGDNDARLHTSLDTRTLQTLGLNDERLQQIRNFAVERGPELLGDLFCPWAKWISIFLTFLSTSDNVAFNHFLARIFGVSNSRSPLQILISSVLGASEELLQDAKKVADVCASALTYCKLTNMMLIMVVGDFVWMWLIVLHVGLFVAHAVLEFSHRVVAHDSLDFCGRVSLFQAAFDFLYFLNPFATPPTFFSRLLIPLVSSVCVFFFELAHYNYLPPGLLLVPCVFVMLFYTPLWFGVCLFLAILVIMNKASSRDVDDITFAILSLVSLCIIRIVVYVSTGAFSGALFVFLLPIVVTCGGMNDDASQAIDMVAPLPLVCALVFCFYTSFRFGVGFTVIICALAANHNVKAVLWWIVSFLALHLLSYAFSHDFSVVTICFFGSYFSYGCIL